MLRNNIKSSWNRSNAFGRKVFPFPQTRVGDLCTATSLSSNPDPVEEQKNVDDVNVALGKTNEEPNLARVGRNEEPNLARVGRKETILSTADPNDTIAVQNSDTVESSGNEKRAAKQKKQKENKSIHGDSVQKLLGDIWTLERAMKHCGVEQKLGKDLTELTEDKKKAKKHQNKKTIEAGQEKKDVVENDFGDWNRSETLGLASVKTGLITPSSELSEGSENGRDLSECSEAMLPSELDTDEILRSLVTDKATEDGFENRRSGCSPKTPDQRSSMTDSSGVETSSDADSEHLTYAIDSDQKSDILSCQHPEDSACEQEAEFITVSKKRKPKSLQVDKSAANLQLSLSSGDFLSPDSGKNSPLQEQNASVCHLPNSTCTDHAIASKESFKLPENSLSQRSAADVTLGWKPGLARQPCDISFDSGREPSVNFSALLENCPAEKRSAGHDSEYLENYSSAASLSDIYLDDFPLSILLNEMLEDNWTVVKNGRRLKNNVQSVVEQTTAGESKRSSPINASHCPTSVTGEHVASGCGRGKTSTDLGRSGRLIQNSRCNSSVGSKSKALGRCWYDDATKNRPQDSSRKNFFPTGVARSNSNSEPKCRDTSGGSLSRCNSNREFYSTERNPFPARCQEIPRFSQKTVVSESDVSLRNSSTSVATSDGDVKTAWVSMPDQPAGDKARNTGSLSTGKTCLSTTEINKSTRSSNLSPHVAKKTSTRCDTFDLIGTQIYLYREYQEVLEERQKYRHLVIIYDPDSEV